MGCSGNLYRDTGFQASLFYRRFKVEAKNWKTEKETIIRCVLLNLAGVFIYAVGINSFAAPHKIAPGGASGIAILINYLTGCPIGLFVFVFNIPLLLIIVVKKYFPRSFVFRTLASTATDLVIVRIPVYKGNPLLAAMFCGAMMGIGLALVHMGQSNTGGISLLGLIMQKCNPQFQVGAWISGLNIAVVLASAMVYRNIESLLYAVVTVYISGMFMDHMLENADAKNLMIVIAESTDKVRQVFLDRKIGVTVLKGEGGYSSEVQRVVMCVSEKKECELLQKRIHKVDDKALVIITEAEKVAGKGFKHLT